MSGPAPEPTAAGEPGYRLHHQPVVDDRRITEIVPESDEAGPDPVRFQASIGATFKTPFRGTPHAEHRDLSVGAESRIATDAAICAVENAWRNDPDRLTPVRRHQLDGFDQFAYGSIVIDEALPNDNDDGPCSVIGRFIPTPYTTYRIPVKIAVDGGEGHNDEVVTLRQINGEEYPILGHLLHINHEGKLAADSIKEPKLTPDARECIMTAILCLTPSEQTKDRQMAGFLPTELRRYLLLRFVAWDSWAGKPWPATVSYDTDGTVEYNDD
jgi:hypothetical protein